MSDERTAPAEIPIDDRRTVEAVRAGDERAYAALVDRHHPALVRLAHAYVGDREVAEDVAQETWVAVLRGIERFEGRSSLKTWIYGIAINQAKTRAARERRSVPFSSLGPADPAVDPVRFEPADDPKWAHWWVEYPNPWDVPEERLLAGETIDVIERAIDDLPPQQRVVITLRDIEGWTADEVCNLLDVRETNQRVLLHRARSRVRRALERYLDEGPVG